MYSKAKLRQRLPFHIQVRETYEVEPGFFPQNNVWNGYQKKDIEHQKVKAVPKIKKFWGFLGQKIFLLYPTRKDFFCIYYQKVTNWKGVDRIKSCFAGMGPFLGMPGRRSSR